MITHQLGFSILTAPLAAIRPALSLAGLVLGAAPCAGEELAGFVRPYEPEARGDPARATARRRILAPPFPRTAARGRRAKGPDDAAHRRAAGTPRGAFAARPAHRARVSRSGALEQARDIHDRRSASAGACRAANHGVRNSAGCRMPGCGPFECGPRARGSALCPSPARHRAAHRPKRGVSS